MSRIGKRVLTIPEKVNVEIQEQKLIVKGPKGELSLDIYKDLKVNVENNEITVEKLNNLKHTNEMHGTTNANIKNMLVGVSEGIIVIMLLIADIIAVRGADSFRNSNDNGTFFLHKSADII